jgi:hypothetical protein
MNYFWYTGAGALGIQVEGPAEAKMTCTGKFFPFKGTGSPDGLRYFFIYMGRCRHK